jgi:hypothetical protein
VIGHFKALKVQDGDKKQVLILMTHKKALM